MGINKWTKSFMFVGMLIACSRLLIVLFGSQSGTRRWWDEFIRHRKLSTGTIAQVLGVQRDFRPRVSVY